VAVGHVLSCLIQPTQRRGEVDSASCPSFACETAAMSASNADLPKTNWPVSSLGRAVNICLGCFEKFNLLPHQALVGRQCFLVLLHGEDSVTSSSGREVHMCCCILEKSSCGRHRHSHAIIGRRPRGHRHEHGADSNPQWICCHLVCHCRCP
jgi:hypothetical protein